jgi:hypothetical protein
LTFFVRHGSENDGLLDLRMLAHRQGRARLPFEQAGHLALGFSKVSVLQDGQHFIAAADGQEVGAPEEHGVVTKQEATAPQEEMRPKDHWAY